MFEVVNVDEGGESVVMVVVLNLLCFYDGVCGYLVFIVYYYDFVYEV